MRGLARGFPLGLVALFCASACGRISFVSQPPPDAGADGGLDASPEPFDASGAGYRVVRIPLRMFQWAGRNLDHAAATTSELNIIWVGGSWSDGAAVRFDEARIRW